MAEYYPLLAKAVGSLPNSTPETRRVVYERARKALIGQLRTLHPPVPDQDIEHESVELDRAIARIETEMAARAAAPGTDFTLAPPSTPLPANPLPQNPSTPNLLPPNLLPPKPSAAKPVPPKAPVSTSANPPVLADKPFQPLRGKVPAPKMPAGEGIERQPTNPDSADKNPADVLEARPTDRPSGVAARMPSAGTLPPPLVMPGGDTGLRPPRLDGQRPIAPQPPAAKGPKRRLWIIPLGIGVVAAIVAVAAWKLRDRPETLVRAKPADTQTQGDTSKIAERVGGPSNADPSGSDSIVSEPRKSANSAPPAPSAPTDAKPAGQTASLAPQNPEVPVAHRAALLVEAPAEDNKVKTFLGTVVWKLNSVNEGQADAASLAVEADVDLPDDKTKAIITFQKNTDPSLPASHTIKVRFLVQPGSATGDIKQINVPQMRREDNPSGEPLAGVTVPVVQNSFLVGLSPGNAETANLELIRSLQWIDVPILLDSGKIAKLTFEKAESGQRDLNEAIASWQK